LTSAWTVFSAFASFGLGVKESNRELRARGIAPDHALMHLLP
jgi:hypothetical protein